MIKVLLCLCVVGIVAQNAEYNYLLYKFYPKNDAQIEFLKLVSQGSSKHAYNVARSVIITPLSKGKTAYVLVPKSANHEFQKKSYNLHLKSIFVEFTTIQQLSANPEIHKLNSFPQSPRANYLIKSPRVTNLGSWGAWGECQPGEFVVGMKLKTEKEQELGDDTGLNAVRLLCAEPGSKSFKEIVSLEASRGQFGRTFYCPEGLQVSGFELSSERSDGARKDATAANNLRILCSAPNREAQSITIEGDGLNFGDWSGAQKCLSGQSVCGFRTQVEPELGIGDDTALNNMDMVCCDIDPVSPRSNPWIPGGLIESMFETAEQYSSTNHEGEWTQSLHPEFDIPPHESVAYGAASWVQHIGLRDFRVTYLSEDERSEFSITVSSPSDANATAVLTSTPDMKIHPIIFYAH